MIILKTVSAANSLTLLACYRSCI